MKNIYLLLCLLFAVFLLNACQTTDLDFSTDTASPTAPPLRTSPVDVHAVFITPQAIEPLVTTAISGNLFSNGGFESGLNDWTGCATGAISSSNDAYEGSQALKINQDNCFYRSVTLDPGQTVVLSCYVKLLSGSNWTGMGLNFVDSSFNILSSTPNAVATSNGYTRIDTEGTAPANTSFVSMWLYSGNPAVVDSCSLTTESEPPPPSSGNLLENPAFGNVDSNNKPLNWSKGCGGTYGVSGTTPGTFSLALSGGACVDQSLSAADIAALAGNSYTLSCDVERIVGYAALTIFINGQANSVPIPTDRIGSGIQVTGTAPSNASSGFVSIYSEGSLTIDDCQLTAGGSPPPADGNLLENGKFEEVNTITRKTTEWSQGCSGTVLRNGRPGPVGTYLTLANGVCLDQSLSSNDTSSLAGKRYSFSCNVFRNTGYAALTVFTNDQVNSIVIPVITNFAEQRVTVTGTAPSSVSSGFVSIYADAALDVDDCVLEILN